MKIRKIMIAFLLWVTLVLCFSSVLQTVNARATKALFNGKLQWTTPPPVDFTDWYAGQTLHRRGRITYLNVIETDNDLFDGRIVRTVNFNRNIPKSITQRWGSFEIVLEDVVLWRGVWTGSRMEDERIENYVGHGVGDLTGLHIKFTLESPDSLVSGYILSTHG